jgi:hypothetical protein
MGTSENTETDDRIWAGDALASTASDFIHLFSEGGVTKSKLAAKKSDHGCKTPLKRSLRHHRFFKSWCYCNLHTFI